MRYDPLTIEQARKILAGYVWKHPTHYAGFSPEGDYVLLTRHRDSDALVRSNWECVRDEIPEPGVLPFDDTTDEAFAARPAVYDWRAGHCMVGWVEYLMVRSDAPDDVLILAAQVLKSLDGYPILNEDHFSDLEMQEAEESWKHLDLRGRLEVIDGCQYDGKPISCFAARHDYPPSDDQGTIEERLR